MSALVAVQVLIKIVRPLGRIPEYQTEQASGADLYAAIDRDLLIQPGQRVLVPSGIALAIPLGYEVQIRPRSGLALKHGISLVNSPGTIDADYRGEIQVIMLNTSQEPFLVTPGLRIAQMVVAPVVQASFMQVDELQLSERGVGGFGSTGV